MKEYMFKIKNNEGLYSNGGMKPDFTRRGKFWRGLGPLMSHLSQLNDLRKLKLYNNCVVETFLLERYENPTIGLTLTSPLEWHEEKEFVKEVFNRERKKDKEKE